MASWPATSWHSAMSLPSRPFSTFWFTKPSGSLPSSAEGSVRGQISLKNTRPTVVSMTRSFSLPCLVLMPKSGLRSRMRLWVETAPSSNAKCTSSKSQKSGSFSEGGSAGRPCSRRMRSHWSSAVIQ